jgi:GT2 family glycosyltransferase
MEIKTLQDPIRLRGSAYPIGVIIPTYNRSDVLISCLKHLERQTWTDFEVIVVDDGSTDSTPRLLEQYSRESPLHLRCFRQNNSGPARARNVAIAALRSPICLMIGDDILVSPALVLAHLRLHQRKPDIQVAALGLTRWSDSGQIVTKFMRWLDESGIQFDYNNLLRGERPNWQHFYTSNLSLKTALLKENPFNESFTKAAAEDLELGYRLEQQQKLEMAFIPEALAHHLHPTSFHQACKRMFNVGVSTQHFHEIWPASVQTTARSRLRSTVRNFFFSHNQLFFPPLTSLANLLTSVWCPNPVMRNVLLAYFLLGYQHAQESKDYINLSTLNPTVTPK